MSRLGTTLPLLDGKNQRPGWALRRHQVAWQISAIKQVLRTRELSALRRPTESVEGRVRQQLRLGSVQLYRIPPLSWCPHISPPAGHARGSRLSRTSYSWQSAFITIVSVCPKRPKRVLDLRPLLYDRIGAYYPCSILVYVLSLVPGAHRYISGTVPQIHTVYPGNV